MTRKRMRNGWRTNVAAGALLGLAWTAAPSRVVAAEMAALQQPGGRAKSGRARTNERTYRGPGFDFYTAGHLAWEQKDWKTAVAQMEQAGQADPDQPAALVRIDGAFFDPYIPKYYRSLAQCKLRLCQEARRDMDEVLALLRDAPGRLRDRYRKDCQQACSVSPP
jgi:hypothetical protein